MNHKNYFIPILDTLKCFKRNIKFWDNASAQWGKLGHKITYLPFYIKLYKILTLLHIIIAIFCFCPCRPAINYFTLPTKNHIQCIWPLAFTFHSMDRVGGGGVGLVIWGVRGHQSNIHCADTYTYWTWDSDQEYKVPRHRNLCSRRNSARFGGSGAVCRAAPECESKVKLIVQLGCWCRWCGEVATFNGCLSAC